MTHGDKTAEVINLRPRPPGIAARGQSSRRLRKPVIYFAGRMNGARGHSDWRDGLGGFEGLYSAAYNTPSYFVDEDGRPCFHRDIKVDCGAFWYGGPFTLETTGGHTNGHCGYFSDDDPQILERQQVWDADKFWIERADLIFAYIADLCAYGTLVEVGYAAAKGKPIALGLSGALARGDHMELWLAQMQAAKVYWGAPKVVWDQITHDWIA